MDDWDNGGKLVVRFHCIIHTDINSFTGWLRKKLSSILLSEDERLIDEDMIKKERLIYRKLDETADNYLLGITCFLNDFNVTGLIPLEQNSLILFDVISLSPNKIELTGSSAEISTYLERFNYIEEEICSLFEVDIMDRHSTNENIDKKSSNKPWLQVADYGFDRSLLFLFWKGYKTYDIACVFNVSEGTINNRLTELRKDKDNKIKNLVPTRSGLRRIGIKTGKEISPQLLTQMMDEFERSGNLRKFYDIK